MKTEFRKAMLPRELPSLVRFDRKVFSDTDRFHASDWAAYESYWLLVDGKKVGCCAFQKNATVSSEDSARGVHEGREGSLYIATTGVLPRFQRMGFGDLLKLWQIAYARHHGFVRIVTNTRKRNAAMIALNRKHGFKVVQLITGYYVAPPDSAIVMELRIEKVRPR